MTQTLSSLGADAPDAAGLALLAASIAVPPR